MFETKTFDADVKIGEEGSEIAGVELGEAEFVSKMSDDRIDRDGEIIDSGAFEPLPDQIVIDADHDTSIRGTVAAGRPFYDDDGVLMVHGKWAQGEHVPLAAQTRALVSQGIIRHMSVRFGDAKREEDDDGVPHVTDAELYNSAFVALPANIGAEVLASKQPNAYYDLSRWQPTGTITTTSNGAGTVEIIDPGRQVTQSVELTGLAGDKSQTIEVAGFSLSIDQLLEPAVKTILRQLLPELFDEFSDPESELRSLLIAALGDEAGSKETTAPDKSEPDPSKAAVEAATRLASDRDKIAAVAEAARAHLAISELT